MKIDSIEVISTSNDGRRRQVVYIGPAEGRRRRKATEENGAKVYPRRKASKTVHQRLEGGHWVP